MTTMNDNQPAQWSSRFAFLMAAIGSSVGLGNLWRFSAQAGENGGAAFIVIYLAFILLIGIPLLVCEYLLGRSGSGTSAVHSVRDLARRSNVSSAWTSLAWLGTTSAFLIVSFYCVVAAWVVIYVGKFLTGAFDQQSAEQIAGQFSETRENHAVVLAYVAVFLALTGAFVARGVNKGIELASKLLMPLFFILLLSLSAYSVWIGLLQEVLGANGQHTSGTALAFDFMFKPDFSKISTDVVVSALGQAFFSIGLGSATMITYGSYINRRASLPGSALVVGLADSGVALIAGFAIFPIVFAFDLNAAGGAGLFFETLPVALTALPLGAIIGAGFFCLAGFAALTTAIALFEVVTAFLIDTFDWQRLKAVTLLTLSVFTLSVASILSSDFMKLLDERITGAVMVPLSGLVAVIFVGWKMNASIVSDQLDNAPSTIVSSLLFLIRFVVPVCVFIVLVAQVLQAFS